MGMSDLNSGNTNSIWTLPTPPKPVRDLTFAPNKDTWRSQPTVLVDPKQLNCLALNIYFEAAIESTAGKLAVAQVTLNRVRHHRYPNSICEVVYEGPHTPSGFPKRDRCQFSWYCDGKLDEPNESPAWRESQRVATYIMEHDHEFIDITDGATHYHANYIDPPRWASSRDRTVSIDTHIFYNKHKKGFNF